MKNQLLHIVILLSLISLNYKTIGQSIQHPSLFLSGMDGRMIMESMDKYPLLKNSFDDAKKIADKGLAEKMDVPVPVDPAGGYTHERHKMNYLEMYNAGLMYVITGKSTYAEFVLRMLLKYGELIPSLPNHPRSKGKTPGRLFWQPLNDVNWMVYASIGYDCVINAATAQQRKTIAEKVFKPMIKFITVDLEPWFNLVHNHGVWASAGVGMSAMVIGDSDHISKALYGTHKDGKSGFIAQLDNLFSPDGYYTEGPYYARYALMPFYIFAQAIQNRIPELKIFNHRNQILKKALYAALQQTNINGAFFPFNDAIKDKTYVTSEMVLAIDIAIAQYGHDAGLLGIVAQQHKVLLNQNGLQTAKAAALYKGVLPSFPYRSVDYTDGTDGNEGGITILRNGSNKNLSTLLFKYGSHGLSHGHYDELNILFYDRGNEILQGYGSARFLNVEQKEGGRYLPENKSFAMQTVAHNTLVVDEKSQFDAKEKTASKYHSWKWFSNLGKDVQVVSAKDSNAYPGVILQRTLTTIDKGVRPLIIDIYKASSATTHRYDLPFWYGGQFIAASFGYTPFTKELKQLGYENGYQHLWNEADGHADRQPTGAITFLNGNSYYSVTTLSDSTTSFNMVMSGASDPNFNLRKEQAFMIRKKGKDALFVTVIEPHGSFDPVQENSSHSKSQVEDIRILADNDDVTVVEIKFKSSESYVVGVANKDNDAQATHSIITEHGTFNWKGPFVFRNDGRNENS